MRSRGRRCLHVSAHKACPPARAPRAPEVADGEARPRRVVHQQRVLQLQVSVRHRLRVHVADAAHHLHEEEAGLRLAEALRGRVGDAREELAACARGCVCV
jgi:hypothetical protein